MFKFYFKFLLFCCCFLGSGLLIAQSCTYQLEMFDTFGDGWNGATLTIELDEVETQYSLTEDMGNGEAFTVAFPVEDGQIMALSYESNVLDEEVSFNIIDANCNTIYSYGPNSTLVGDSIFVDTLTCPACITPNLCELPFATRLRSSSVDINYSSVAPDTANNAPVYLIEFGPTGFTPGTGTFLTTNDTIFRIQPLEEQTGYDVYVSTICYTGQDTSNQIGPLNIFTPWTSDVGASSLTNPISGCELAAEEIRIGLTNFGGEAKTLIPFGLSINGVEQNISFPNDGLYTGVLGVDSTEFTSFDLTPNFGSPGEYELEVWTYLDGDQNLSNDTFTTYLYSAPTEGVYPYFIDFEEEDGFWMDQERNDTLSSWKYGSPNAANIFEAAGGQRAWVSNLDGFTSAGEVSYLYSPCFDLSANSIDPVISFDFINALVGNNTRVVLEVATDGGDFIKVGTSNEGLNWYNYFLENSWGPEFDATPEWQFSAIKIDGLAGANSARFRFKLTVDENTSNNEGVGIDNFYLSPQAEAELVAISVNDANNVACGSVEDYPTITFANLGSNPASDIVVSYRANGGEIVSENFPSTLSSFEQATYTFLTPYDGSQSNQNEIVAWVSLDGDEFEPNDTARTILTVRQDIPFFEDFEEGIDDIRDWFISNNSTVANEHNAGSNVLFANLSGFDSIMIANSPNFGPVEAGDSLLFDYRFVDALSDGQDPINLLDGDSLTVDLIVNCDLVISGFVRITSENHTATTEFTHVAIELPANLNGSNLQLVFKGQADLSGDSDFFLDLDNINIKRCLPSLDVTAGITNVQDSMGLGRIGLTPNAGAAPFSYDWSNGANTAVVNDLAIGDYTVTVTDAQGCSEVYSYSVIISSTEEQLATAFADLKVFPNPTNGLLQIQLDLPNNEALEYSLYNQMGQRIHNKVVSNMRQLNETIDLNNQPAGIYFLRLASGENQKTVRVVKTR